MIVAKTNFRLAKPAAVPPKAQLATPIMHTIQVALGLRNRKIWPRPSFLNIDWVIEGQRFLSILIQ